MGMLRPLRLYLLIAVVVALGWLNLRAPAGVEVVKAMERAVPATALPLGSPQATIQSSQRMAATPLPEKVTRPTLEAAARDPFVLKASPVAVLAPLKPAPPPAIAVQVVVPPLPVAPPLNVTFAGRMTAPDGSQVVYVANGATTQAIGIGQDLPNGYRVEAITAQAVEFSSPPLKTNARLDLPAAPKFEIR